MSSWNFVCVCDLEMFILFYFQIFLIYFFEGGGGVDEKRQLLLLLPCFYPFCYLFSSRLCDVTLVPFMYLAISRMLGEKYHRPITSLLRPLFSL